MNKFVLMFAFSGIILFSPMVFAKSSFCSGFEVGYKSIKGDFALVPLCPLEPLTPLGSTPYREGILKGQEVARN
tara:strand:+ start:155 stop:376 length:222 start_codon:yes stop_codon:yes gene_type:complete